MRTGTKNLDHERFRLMVKLRSAVGQLLLETEDTTGAIAQAETAINAVDDFCRRLLFDEEG
jgi:hypothetical protein